MLTDIYTITWPPMSAELMKRTLSEKMEQLFLCSKNRQFVQMTEQETTLKECCVDDTTNEPEEIL